MTRWHSISSGRINLEHTGHFRPWTRRWRKRQRRKEEKQWKGGGERLKIGMTWSTVKDPSDSIHRDHLSLVLVQTRAHYNSHNRPDITSAVARGPARRSSPESHPSLPRDDPQCERHALSSSLALRLRYFAAIRNLPRSRSVSSGHHRLWYAVTGPTTPATRVKTNAPCPTRESSPRTNSVRVAPAVARPNLAAYAALGRPTRLETAD